MQAQTACVESFPMGRQFTQVIHLGHPRLLAVLKSAAQDLAKSMVSNAVMKALGPYAMMASFATGGSCNGAQDIHDEQPRRSRRRAHLRRRWRLHRLSRCRLFCRSSPASRPASE